jgi:hypothetical protein
MNANLSAGIITVCAWCDPGYSIFVRFPAWRDLGLTISHGICRAHLAQMRPAARLPGNPGEYIAPVTPLASVRKDSY